MPSPTQGQVESEKVEGCAFRVRAKYVKVLLRAAGGGNWQRYYHCDLPSLPPLHSCARGNVVTNDLRRSATLLIENISKTPADERFAAANVCTHNSLAHVRRRSYRAQYKRLGVDVHPVTSEGHHLTCRTFETTYTTDSQHFA